MMRHWPLLSLLSLITLATALTATSPATAVLHGTEDFDEFRVFIEINATDGDAGFQGKLDGKGWARAKVRGPDGRTLYDHKPRRSLREQGVTEVQWESAEPPFDQAPLEEFLERFPEGLYTAHGRAIDGDRLYAEHELTHVLPAGPVILSHQDGDVIDAAGDTIELCWEPVDTTIFGCRLESEVIKYEVVAEYEFEVDGEEVKRVLTIEVDADQSCAEIPTDFLPAGQVVKLEVGVEEQSGNRTFTEIEVEVAEDCGDDDDDDDDDDDGDDDD